MSNAIVRIIYKENSASCYHPANGSLSQLGRRIIDELEEIHHFRSNMINEYIHLLKNMEVVSKNSIPTEEQKARLLPYTHINLEHLNSQNSWASLLYGTRESLDAMLRAGIYCDTNLSPENLGTVYTIDLLSRTINVLSYAEGSQQTYRFEDAPVTRRAFERDLLWLPDDAPGVITQI
jgi:hypothetical protein